MKKIICLLLAIYMAFSVSSCEKTETIPAETTGETETHFVDSQKDTPTVPAKGHIPHSGEPDREAQNAGYQKGTYEYEYYSALSDISFCVTVCDIYMGNAKNQTQNDYIQAYLETVDIERFIKPYETILPQAKILLQLTDFGLCDMDAGGIFQYMANLEYEFFPEEKMIFLALSFQNFADRMYRSAKNLAMLSEKYPGYTGDFAMTGLKEEASSALADACLPVFADRDALHSTWRTFYEENIPSVTVSETYDKEHNCLKLVISEPEGCHVNINSRFVENTHYMTGYKMPIVIYIPISSVAMGLTSFEIERSGPYVKTYTGKYDIKTDYKSYFSDEPLQLQDPFLHAAMTDFFGGSYSERDLLSIQSIQFEYAKWDGESKQPPTIQIAQMQYSESAKWHNFEYTDYFGETEEAFEMDITPELLQDLSHFKGLIQILANGKNDSKAFREKLDSVREELYPYYVNPQS